MNEHPYSYFISYSHAGGFGSMQIDLSQPITHISDIILIRETIEEQGFESVVVLFYDLLSVNDDTNQ
jgi:hypothetical protein